MRMTTLSLALAAGLGIGLTPALAGPLIPQAMTHSPSAAIIKVQDSTVTVKKRRGPFGGTKTIRKKYSVGPMGRRCKTVTIRKRGPMGGGSVRKIRRCE